MSVRSASFPNSVWDGTSSNPDRHRRVNDVDPDYHDYDIMSSEIIAIQTYSLNLQTQITANMNSTPAVALATTATTGFLYVPTCAGTPTGVPVSVTGKAPIVIDSTNNFIYVYVGSSWLKSALT